MAKHKGDLIFTGDVRRLLDTLIAVLSECKNSEGNHSNLPHGKTVVTDEEVRKLVLIFEKLLSSKDFIETIYFVEGLMSGKQEDEARLKKIFLSARMRRSKGSPWSTVHWTEFLARMGIESDRSSTPQMNFDEFVEIEKYILRKAGVPPFMVGEIIDIITRRSKIFKNVVQGKRSWQHGYIRKVLTKSFLNLRKRPASSKNLISTTQLIGAVTLGANLGAIFSTRDLGAAGTYSTVSGALIMTFRR